jgi:hypothetical protein
MRASSLPTTPTNSTATSPEHYLDTRYEVSHISSHYYFLMFNSHLTNKDFKAFFAKTLTLIGYISFLWSPAAKSEEHSLSYKVWLDLVDLLPHLWAFDELAVLTSSFGLILAHSSLNKVASFERMRLSIATDALLKIPRAICLFLNGIRTIAVIYSHRCPIENAASYLPIPQRQNVTQPRRHHGLDT